MNSSLNKNLLVKIFSEGCKEKIQWKIGTEHEKFGFKKKSLEPINFHDIQQIFLKLSNKYNWERYFFNTFCFEIKI